MMEQRNQMLRALGLNKRENSKVVSIKTFRSVKILYKYILSSYALINDLMILHVFICHFVTVASTYVFVFGTFEYSILIIEIN